MFRGSSVDLLSEAIPIFGILGFKADFYEMSQVASRDTGVPFLSTKLT